MEKLAQRIHDEQNGIDYILAGDYYVPDIKLPTDHRHIGKWGRMYRAYIKEVRPAFYSRLLLTGEIHTYLADVDAQARSRYECIMHQMQQSEGVTEELKHRSQFDWVCAMNSIANRAEEIVKAEMIYV